MFPKKITTSSWRAIVAFSAIIIFSTIYCWATTKSVIPSESAQGVKIAELPRTLEFAGEKVPLELAYVREAVEREMITTSCMHTSTTIALRNTTRYFPIIEPILKENNIPEDFKYLCIAESGLNPNAQSPAQACGLWQFVKSAAKDYGIETGDNVDLRYNIEEATRAACRYFKSAYERFGSWALVAASYNAGIAGVSRRLEIQQVSNYWDLFLPEETMRYVPRILSFKIIFAEPEKYGFMLEKSNYLPTFKNYIEVQISSQDIEWSKFAAQHHTDYRQLRILNPWIRSYEYANKTGKNYTVKVPTAQFKELGY